MGQLVGIARREKKYAEMETLEDAEISEQSGVAKDSRGKPGERQVTVISAEAWALACKELGQEIPGPLGGPTCSSKTSSCRNAPAT